MSEETTRKGLTRRNFLKTTAVASGATALVIGSANALAAEDQSQASSEKVYAGVCRGNCAGNCFLNVTVREGKVVKTSVRDLPNTGYNRICVKGLTHQYRLYGSERIKYPMRRIGERGAGEWERISWDEALKEIAEKWKNYQKQNGNGALAFCVGYGSNSSINGVGVGGAYNICMGALGARKIDPSVDLAFGAGTTPVVGQSTYCVQNAPADMLNTRTIICWGCNPVQAQIHNVHWMYEARDKGAKIVVIDPEYTITAAKADKYIPIRPGSDGALMLGLMRYIIEQGWEDRQFLVSHSDSAFLVREDTRKYLMLSDASEMAEGADDDYAVMDTEGNLVAAAGAANPDFVFEGEINGIKVTTSWNTTRKAVEKYTLGYTSSLTEVDEATIMELADMLCHQGPCAMYTLMGLNHWWNGIYTGRDMASLAALTGNTGKHGAFFGAGEGLGTNFLNFVRTNAASRPNSIGASPAVSVLHFPEIMNGEDLGSETATIKTMYIQQCNFLGNVVDHSAMFEAMMKVEYIVGCDMTMTETCRYCDIVLPAAHWFEENDMVVAYGTHPYVLWQEKAVEPSFEAKPDFEIYKLLLGAMGHGDTLDISEMDYLEMLVDTDAARTLGITPANLVAKKAINFIPDDYVHGEGGIFPTTTKRAQLFNQAPTPGRMWGQTIDVEKENKPYWEPPTEAWPENALAGKYPFVLLWDRPRWRTHTQWSDCKLFLDEYYKEPKVQLAPTDADQYGLAEGDIARVYNERGQVKIKVTINPGVRPGTVKMPKGWDAKYFIEGHAQSLMRHEAHPMIENSEFADALVAIEKA